jgi:hypothetical protein
VQLIPGPKRNALLFEPSSHLPFAAKVYATHKLLLSAGVQSGPGAVLPSKPESFWTMYSEDGPERKLQRVLSGMMEAKRLAALMDSFASSKRDQQRLESLGSCNAGAWLTAYPSTPDLSLSNSEFCLAARLRLALPGLRRSS